MLEYNYLFSGSKDCLKYLLRKCFFALINFLALSPSFRPFQDLRIFLLRACRYSIGSNCNFSENLFILNFGYFSIGSNSKIGHFCRIYNFHPIVIGKDLLASHGLTIISGTHDPESLHDKPGPVEIGSNVWIGINVTIVGPVKIGTNSVIGAGSLVLKDIPNNAIAAGVPARVIRFKNPNNAK